MRLPSSAQMCDLLVPFRERPGCAFAQPYTQYSAVFVVQVFYRPCLPRPYQSSQPACPSTCQDLCRAGGAEPADLGPKKDDDDLTMPTLHHQGSLRLTR